MRKAYTTLTVFLAFLFATNCYAKLPASFNNNGSYDLLRVTTPSGVRVKLKQATIGEGVIISDLGKLRFDDVNILECKSGTHQTAGMIWGTVIGGVLGAAVSIATVKEETNEIPGGYEIRTTVQTWPIYAGTLGGFLIGYLIGNGSPKYAVLYKETAPHSGLNGKLRLGMGLSANSQNGHQTPILTFNCNF